MSSFYTKTNQNKMIYEGEINYVGRNPLRKIKMQFLGYMKF